MAPALALNCFDKGGGCEGGDRGTDWSKGGDCETIERNRGEGLLLDKTKFIFYKMHYEICIGGKQLFQLFWNLFFDLAFFNGKDNRQFESHQIFSSQFVPHP